jgi:hypothetical protein
MEENGMNLRAKIYVETQKKSVQGKLEARLVSLKEKGIDEAVIKKDATVRKLKAEVRKADFRLASIAAQEKLNQERAQAKIDKVAAEKAAREAPKTEAAGAAPEKKETTGKKEKPEKQAKSEGKKERSEGKKEKPEGKKENQEKRAEKTEDK